MKIDDEDKNKEKIIAVVGLCGAGKSIVCNYIQSKNYEKVYFGGNVIEEVKKRGLEVIEKNEKSVREELRKKHGMEAMAILSLDKINDHLKNGRSVLIDGLYSMSEYRVLKSSYPFMVTLAVFTSKEIRYKRLSQRPTRPLTPKEAEQRDIAEIENIEKGGPIALADYTLINDTDISSLQKQIDKVFKRLSL